MSTDARGNVIAGLNGLPAKPKPPATANILDQWVSRVERSIGSQGGRLGWLVASSIVTAVLQRIVDTAGQPLFLLKGGTMLQFRLPDSTRSTTDVDGMVRGSVDDFLGAVDGVLQEDWGPIEFTKGPVEEIDVPVKLVKPRRLDIILNLHGKTWRRVQVELSPDERLSHPSSEAIRPPSLGGLGLPTPTSLVLLATEYQIAQKIHAATGPHEPPRLVNDRARDVVDLLLLRDLVRGSGSPTSRQIRDAVVDTYETRAKETAATGNPPQVWPSVVVAYPHWEASYRHAAQSAGVGLPLAAAVEAVNGWIREINSTG